MRKTISTLTLCSALALSALASPAFGQGPTGSTPDWSGPYAGIQIGYGWGTNRYEYSPTDETTENDMSGIAPAAANAM